MKKLLLILLPLAIVCLGGCTRCQTQEECEGQIENFKKNYCMFQSFGSIQELPAFCIKYIDMPNIK